MSRHIMLNNDDWAESKEDEETVLCFCHQRRAKDIDKIACTVDDTEVLLAQFYAVICERCGIKWERYETLLPISPIQLFDDPCLFDSAAEKAFWDGFLLPHNKATGTLYYPQVAAEVGSSYYFIDFADVRTRFGYEIDGKQHEHWRARERDAYRDSRLRAIGYEIIRVKPHYFMGRWSFQSYLP